MAVTHCVAAVTRICPMCHITRYHGQLLPVPSGRASCFVRKLHILEYPILLYGHLGVHKERVSYIGAKMPELMLGSSAFLLSFTKYVHPTHPQPCSNSKTHYHTYLVWIKYITKSHTQVINRILDNSIVILAFELHQVPWRVMWHFY